MISDYYIATVRHVLRGAVSPVSISDYYISTLRHVLRGASQSSVNQ